MQLMNTIGHDAAIKMKPIDVKTSAYIDFEVESNDKDLKFQVSHHVIISKFENIFSKGYTPDWLEEVFAVKKVKKYCTMDICNRRP